MNVVNRWPGDEIVNDQIIFNSNDPKYKCFCQQCHALTGVKIIAGLICVTVLMEIWHLAWYLLSGNSTNEGFVSSSFQLLVGMFLSLTIIYGIWKEKPAFLLPYLLLQTVGLAAGFVILFALIYVTIIDDISTINAFFESHGSNALFDGAPYKQNKFVEQPSYLGWMLVGSCVIVIVLQFWLISIVFSCWRYFRDKRAVGYIKGYNSYIVLRPPFFNNPGNHQPQNVAKSHKILRSISVDDIYAKTRYRSHSTTVKTDSSINIPRLSSSSYDCTNIPTIIIS